MCFLSRVSVALKSAVYYFKLKDSTSTDELSHWITEMDSYKEMRQDIYLNVLLVWGFFLFGLVLCGFCLLFFFVLFMKPKFRQFMKRRGRGRMGLNFY